MSRILLIGATGGVGSRLAPMLIASGHQVTGLHRSLAQAEKLRAQGVTPVAGDLMEMDAGALAEIARDHDIIIFSAGAAGSGAERTSEIDGRGPLKMIAAAKACGIARVYLVSAMPEAGRGGQPKLGFEHYMRVKKEADAALVASDLDWVILRPGTLLAEDGDDAVSLAPALVYGKVKRGNVAAVLAGLVECPEIRREILELTDGTTPVAEAVAACFRD
ncbi:putative sugar epimerase YhfK [Pseudooceanicola marinus]|uniref:Putative sugar epimerase YhfK n=1 Tax=Pseudooceanicola marinus TaxID=396013 RepID=A0A1X6Y6K3_9RHOB|nr:NAD(P)H-binding protein [Pseudooceanicola marinus]PJE33264.1 NAD-dependent dehydratase [Pseudooceanicola marinus]SLN12397.1 putative sugar epimerase YhfK [Pseudooceanicola marinus]